MYLPERGNWLTSNQPYLNNPSEKIISKGSQIKQKITESLKKLNRPVREKPLAKLKLGLLTSDLIRCFGKNLVVLICEQWTRGVEKSSKSFEFENMRY